jgi:hypothetical protein
VWTWRWVNESPTSPPPSTATGNDLHDCYSSTVAARQQRWKPAGCYLTAVQRGQTDRMTRSCLPCRSATRLDAPDRFDLATLHALEPDSADVGRDATRLL